MICSLFVMPKMLYCSSPILPYCHLSNIPITECCAAPLPYCHLSCANCPLSCYHLSCIVLPAQVVILYYASFADCRPALHVIYQVLRRLL
ncbi:hypothetical protein Patl1_02843 [Pistacia atlantica]|uniref:Uncharacterized protein n=1 Tax=Pistacia atlantica TaxID=434234 RepID=A0ACC1C908_9ROSI|nr:hypothetical protein Patl1_02843 [Pistacia atlantica]